jgi:hypothetical protein
VHAAWENNNKPKQTERTKSMTVTELTVKRAFLRLPILLFIGYCENVFALLTGNPNFTTTFPVLAEIRAAIDKLKLLAQVAMDRSKQAIIDRNVALKELRTLMRQLAAYVQAHMQNDLSILTSSGFEPLKTPEKVGDLEAPVTPIVARGKNSGGLGARVPKLNGVSAYNWRIALASAPTVFVQTKQTAYGRVAFAGLTPGQLYNVQASALGAAGESDWSNTACLMVI